MTTALRREAPEPLHRLLETIALTLVATTSLALMGAVVGAALDRISAEDA